MGRVVDGPARPGTESRAWIGEPVTCDGAHPLGNSHNHHIARGEVRYQYSLFCVKSPKLFALFSFFLFCALTPG